MRFRTQPESKHSLSCDALPRALRACRFFDRLPTRTTISSIAQSAPGGQRNKNLLLSDGPLFGLAHGQGDGLGLGIGNRLDSVGAIGLGGW